MNTELRAKATHDFGFFFFKLMNNPMFGKNDGEYQKAYKHQARNQ